MEITFTQSQHYSLVLDTRLKKELAAELDIPVRRLNKLAKDEELMSEYGEQIQAWVGDRVDQAEVTDHGDVEIDEVNP